jgi:hypothetical protein
MVFSREPLLPSKQCMPSGAARAMKFMVVSLKSSVTRCEAHPSVEVLSVN